MTGTPNRKFTGSLKYHFSGFTEWMGKSKQEMAYSVQWSTELLFCSQNHRTTDYPSWEGSRKVMSSSWFHTGPAKIQTLCLRVVQMLSELLQHATLLQLCQQEEQLFIFSSFQPAAACRIRTWRRYSHVPSATTWELMWSMCLSVTTHSASAVSSSRPGGNSAACSV